MNIARLIKKCKMAWDVLALNAKASYSQTGEDVIIEYLFNSLKIYNPSYLEIGTNYPKVCNNTYRMYLNGSRGVCIEPDYEMFLKIKTSRPKDTVLNIGVGTEKSTEAPFYLFPRKYNGWSTFVKADADLKKNETKVDYVVKNVNLVTVNEIIDVNFSSYPNFISLDVEGLDLEILKSINLKKYPIEVICVETITFGYLNNSETKINEITDFMKSVGYAIYADTHINTIYCKKDLFSFTND